MIFNRLNACLLAMVLGVATISAQSVQPKVKFGDISPADFAPKVYEVDSSANAVYLYDIGSSKHIGNSQGWFSVVYTVHERIRLLNKKSFDNLGTVKIPLFKLGNDMERVSDLQASTFNIEDGKVVETKVDKNSVFKDKDGDNQIVKFTFPDLKEGCIIEYSFTKTIPNFLDIPSWHFQGQYPKLWSEFSTEIPQFFDFIVLSPGYLEPVLDTVLSSADNFRIFVPSNGQVYDFRSNTIKHTWAYKDVPVIKEEKFITDLDNYVQKLEFQLFAIRPPNESPSYYIHTWNEMVDKLMQADDFGADLSKNNGWLKDDIEAAVQNESDTIEKAKKIYEYIQKNYSCINHSAILLSQPLRKTQQTKKGNVSDINMLLIAMLRNAGFDADPVLLSTRGHGKTNSVYPIMSKYNYVIARLNIDDNKFYLLDAARPLLGFSKLDEDCYNGYARVIASAPVLINLSSDSLHESEETSLIITNDDNGKMTGNYQNTMGIMQSVNMRKKMQSSSVDDYFKNVKKSFALDVDLANINIDSLQKTDMPVAVKYNISFKPDEDVLYFSPVVGDAVYKENPFSAAERFYPVEMPYCSDETYILNMEIPKGYKIDELPKSTRVSLNSDEGMFEYLVQSDDQRIQLLCRIKIDKATFEPDDYQTLRNFFALIVEKEGEQIVFKKL